MEEFNEIIKKICKEEGIKLTLLSDNWLTVLEKNNEIHYIQGYKFELNNHGIGNIMDDKGLFYDICRYKKIPIIEHKVIFKDYNKKDILDYFDNHHKEIVVKGNIGTCGEEVFKVNKENDLFNVLDKLFLKEFSISLCPYYDIINEYRVIVLNGVSRIIYGKERPKVIGDGIHNVRDLAKKMNSLYNEKEYLIENPFYCPKKNEIVLLNFQFNLSRGALMFTDIKDSLKNELSTLAIYVSKALNITFGSIDIIKTRDNKLLVMEANSGVMMNNYIRFNKENGYNDAYNLYKDAINLMFKI